MADAVDDAAVARSRRRFQRIDLHVYVLYGGIRANDPQSESSVPQLKGRFGRSQKQTIAGAAGEEFDARIGLTAILLEGQRQPAVRVLVRRLGDAG